jgi:hypothetical protein
MLMQLQYHALRYIIFIRNGGKIAVDSQGTGISSNIDLAAGIRATSLLGFVRPWHTRHRMDISSWWRQLLLYSQPLQVRTLYARAAGTT